MMRLSGGRIPAIEIWSMDDLLKCSWSFASPGRKEIRRLPLGGLGTPLEPLAGASHYLRLLNLLIKRDDLTGLAGGGNKVRKLEFFLGEHLEPQHDTLVTVGAIQSNHARQTAAAAARCGLRSVLVLEDRRPDSHDRSYEKSGNILLNRLLDPEIIRTDTGAHATTLEQVLTRLRNEGRNPLFIPSGASTPSGSLGYIHCAAEMWFQASALGLSIENVVTANGSAGTQAGLIAGFRLLGKDVKVWGISHGEPSNKRGKVKTLLNDIEAFLGVDLAVDEKEILSVGDYVDGGYGVPGDATRQAMQLIAKADGIILDPVYTGKSFAGLCGLVRKGAISRGEVTVFLHTGGTPGLFAYADHPAFNR